jgi:hypothetical protein
MKYKSKQYSVDAVRYDGSQESKMAIFALGIAELGEDFLSSDLTIQTPEGEQIAKIGDYVFKDESGDFWAGHPDSFEAAYEPEEPTQ